MIKIILLILPIYIYAIVDISSSLVTKKLDNSFITKYEYGKMLYNNPRGVSCKECHGPTAKGKTVVRFFHKTKAKRHHCAVRTRDITNVSLKDFLNKLDPNATLKKIELKKEDVCKKLIYGNTMPKYFLTNDELQSLYFYIKNVRNKR